ISASRSVTIPPDAFFCAPESNLFHSPSGPLSNSRGSLPTQYSTRYVVAKGAAHAMRIAFTDFCDFKSTTTHCGCSVSLSPVNFEVRYGLLFQYVSLGPVIGRSPLVEKPRWGSAYGKM